jgi:hypothetical protein
LRAQLINRAFRTMWRLPEAKAESRPAFVTHMYHGAIHAPTMLKTSNSTPTSNGASPTVREGDPRPIELRLSSGDIIRFQCTKLPWWSHADYTDVTDLVCSRAMSWRDCVPRSTAWSRVHPAGQQAQRRHSMNVAVRASVAAAG